MCLRKFQECFEKVSRVFQQTFKDVSRKFKGCFNPIRPGVRNPGKNPGGGTKCPQLSFGFSGLFIQPLVSMLTHIKTKGVITDLMGQKDQQNLENSLIYGIFLSADKFFRKFWFNFFQT